MNMNTTIKSAIIACGFIATISWSLVAIAETFVFHGKDAYGRMGDYTEVNGVHNWEVSAFQFASKGNSSPKAMTSGAFFHGRYYDYENNLYCTGSGSSTDNIDFKMTSSGSPVPKTVVASGTIPLAWYCRSEGRDSEYTDTISFNMDLSIIRNEIIHSWGTIHNDDKAFKYHYQFNSSDAPASLNTSSAISTQFGPLTPTYGSVSNSKGHQISIIK